MAEKKPKLTLIRGISGSGKSTMAVKMTDSWWQETDLYFYNEFDEYHFDKSKLKKNHNLCFNDVKSLLDFGANVVVSNTFIKPWEAKRYIDLAKENGYELEIISLTTDYGSIHAPEHVVDRQKKSYCLWNKVGEYEYEEGEYVFKSGSGECSSTEVRI